MKVLQVTLLMAVALCVAGAASAATNSIPYQESFEVSTTYGAGFTNGQSIVDEPAGWYAASTENGTVITQTLAYLGGQPISAASHDQVLEFVDTVTNFVAGGGGSNVWIDCLLNPTRVEDGQEPEGLTDAKTMVYFNTNGYPVVWGGYQDSASSNIWHTSTTAQVGSGQWARVTIELNLIPDGFTGYEYFKVYVDNTELKFADGLATAGGSPALGPWLRTVEESANNEDLKSVTLSGTGQMDDLQVVLETPLTVTTYSITASVDVVSSATIDPSGTFSVSESNDVPFTISANGGYTVTNVYVSYSWFTGWVGPTNAYTMTNVVSDGSITVYAEADAPQVTQVYGTPYSFYDDHFSAGSWTSDDYENADTNDLDFDGMFGYQENLTGTDPNDSNSYFRVLSIMYAGDSNKVSFFGTSDYGAPSMWSMYRSVSLTNDWDLIRTNDIAPATVDPEDDGTNEWWDLDAPSNTPVFYRPSSHVE
ncbi:MAG: hypothetical protein QGH42_10250 [Kiritimatiellia bacterium]|nr:hypothetical protein [Kiritimatiellia bacterium]